MSTTTVFEIEPQLSQSSRHAEHFSHQAKQLHAACRPPLLLAVQSRPVSFAMVELILKARKTWPQVVDQADKAGTTALGYAMQHNLADEVVYEVSPFLMTSSTNITPQIQYSVNDGIVQPANAWLV